MRESFPESTTALCLTAVLPPFVLLLPAFALPVATLVIRASSIGIKSRARA
jgi:hypothetical protein